MLATIHLAPSKAGLNWCKCGCHLRWCERLVALPEECERAVAVELGTTFDTGHKGLMPGVTHSGRPVQFNQLISLENGHIDSVGRSPLSILYHRVPTSSVHHQVLALGAGGIMSLATSCHCLCMSLRRLYLPLFLFTGEIAVRGMACLAPPAQIDTSQHAKTLHNHGLGLSQSQQHTNTNSRVCVSITHTQNHTHTLTIVS